MKDHTIYSEILIACSIAIAGQELQTDYTVCVANGIGSLPLEKKNSMAIFRPRKEALGAASCIQP